MKINDFINFNRFCPCCHRKLSLFMVSQRNHKPTLWKGRILKKYIEFYNKNNPLDRFKIFEGEQDHLLEKYRSGIRSLWTDDFYFFYICNPRSIKIKHAPSDFDIVAFHACYYRASPLMRCLNISDRKIELVSSEDTFTNSEELFCFSLKEENCNKAFILNLDYQDNKSKLWHYKYSGKNKITEDAKILEIELPLMKNRLSFLPEDRQKLFEKFNYWILMS